MSKHTPGPWRAWHDSYGRFQIMAGGLPLSPSRDGAQPGEGEANAALIAAAPVLLAALTHIINARDHYAEHNEYPLHPLGPNNDQCFDDWAADLAERALDMAGGAK